LSSLLLYIMMYGLSLRRTGVYRKHTTRSVESFLFGVLFTTRIVIGVS